MRLFPPSTGRDLPGLQQGIGGNAVTAASGLELLSEIRPIFLGVPTHQVLPDPDFGIPGDHGRPPVLVEGRVLEQQCLPRGPRHHVGARHVALDVIFLGPRGDTEIVAFLTEDEVGLQRRHRPFDGRAIGGGENEDAVAAGYHPGCAQRPIERSALCLFAHDLLERLPIELTIEDEQDHDQQQTEDRENGRASGRHGAELSHRRDRGLALSVRG